MGMREFKDSVTGSTKPEELSPAVETTPTVPDERKTTV
jgi:hypothetical protein